MPINEIPPSKEMEQLVHYCNIKSLPQLLGLILMNIISSGACSEGRKKPRESLTSRHLPKIRVLAKRYSIAVSNSLAALADLPDDVEASWSAVCTTILTAVQGTIPVTCGKNRPWPTPDMLSILDKKCEARLSGSIDEWRKYKGIFKARSKADLEAYYTKSRRGSGGRYWTQQPQQYLPHN